MLLYEILRKFKVEKRGLAEEIIAWQKDLTQRSFQDGIKAERQTEIKCQYCHRPVERGGRLVFTDLSTSKQS